MQNTQCIRRKVTTSADSAPRGQEEGGRYAQSLCKVTGARRFSSKRPGGVRRVCTDTGYDLVMSQQSADSAPGSPEVGGRLSHNDQLRL